MVMEKGTIIVRPARRDRGEDKHPWVYKSRIVSVGAGVEPGDVVTVVDRKGVFIGRGYYNPASMISIRLMTRQDEYIDKGLFDRRIAAALEKRKEMTLESNAYRLIFSEADELPGLVIDIYADTAVFQTFTLGMEKLKNIAVQSLKDIAAPSRIYEKSDSFIRDLEGLSEIKGWWGDRGDRYVEIFEGSVKYCVDVEEGHKTGFYLDQRRSRLAFSRIAKNKRVLDLFCYTGGFGVAAAAYGASNVLAIDTKEDWLELGRKNAVLNGVSEKIKFVKGDSFPCWRGLPKKMRKSLISSYWTPRLSFGIKAH
jgi:23S rRNA (cytosine1962-C5)-methyltransferase